MQSGPPRCADRSECAHSLRTRLGGCLVPYAPETYFVPSNDLLATVWYAVSSPSYTDRCRGRYRARHAETNRHTDTETYTRTHTPRNCPQCSQGPFNLHRERRPRHRQRPLCGAGRRRLCPRRREPQPRALSSRSGAVRGRAAANQTWSRLMGTETVHSLSVRSVEACKYIGAVRSLALRN